LDAPYTNKDSYTYPKVSTPTPNGLPCRPAWMRPALPFRVGGRPTMAPGCILTDVNALHDQFTEWITTMVSIPISGVSSPIHWSTYPIRSDQPAYRLGVLSSHDQATGLRVEYTNALPLLHLRAAGYQLPKPKMSVSRMEPPCSVREQMELAILLPMVSQWLCACR